MVTIVTTETTGEVQGRAREEQQGLETRHISSPSVCFFSFFYLLNFYLHLEIRTTAMMTNNATTSTHLNTPQYIETATTAAVAASGTSIFSIFFA